MTRRFLTYFFILLLPFAAALVPARASAAADQPYAKIATHAIAVHVLPSLKAFSAATKAQAGALHALAWAPTPASLTAARSAYQAASDAWQAVQHLRRGPAETDFRHQRIQFWPDKRGHVRKQLAVLLAGKDKSEITPAVLSKASVAVQGFPALERLLYGEAPPKGFALKLAAAIGDNMAAIAIALETDWRDPAKGFGKLLATPGPTNPLFGDAKAIAGFLSTDLAAGMKALDELKLRRVVGRDGAAQIKRAENWRSDRSLANIRINLETFAALFQALVHDADLDKHDRARAKFVADQFAQIISEARALGPSFTKAVAAERGIVRLRGLAAGVEDLYELMGGFLAEVLKLSMGFNSLDGD